MGLSATNNLQPKVRRAVEARLRTAMVHMHMGGSVQGFVWGGGFAGTDQSHRGMVVLIFQYGMKAHGFYVRDGVLHFRGRRFKLEVAK